MNLTELSVVFEKLFNKLGNKYLTRNFITEPFEFNVKVRYGTDQEYHDYIVEVYSNPPMPNTFKYRPEIIKRDNKVAEAADISVINSEFKKLYDYVKSDNRYYGIKFMNVIKKGEF
jgi:hypothetical protein